MARKNEGLDKWERTGQSTVRDQSSLPSLEKRLYYAAKNKETIKIIYHGGTSAGSPRNITPTQLFRKYRYGGLYVKSYCHIKKAVRTFRMDRIEIPSRTTVRPRPSLTTGGKRTHASESKRGGCFTVLLVVVITASAADPSVNSAA